MPFVLLWERGTRNQKAKVLLFSGLFREKPVQPARLVTAAATGKEPRKGKFQQMGRLSLSGCPWSLGNPLLQPLSIPSWAAPEAAASQDPRGSSPTAAAHLREAARLPSWGGSGTLRSTSGGPEGGGAFWLPAGPSEASLELAACEGSGQSGTGQFPTRCLTEPSVAFPLQAAGLHLACSSLL